MAGVLLAVAVAVGPVRPMRTDQKARPPACRSPWPSADGTARPDAGVPLALAVMRTTSRSSCRRYVGPGGSAHGPAGPDAGAPLALAVLRTDQQAPTKDASVKFVLPVLRTEQQAWTPTCRWPWPSCGRAGGPGRRRAIGRGRPTDVQAQQTQPPACRWTWPLALSVLRTDQQARPPACRWPWPS